MKKLFAVLCCGLMMALISCGDDKKEETQWFKQPEVTQITGNTALVSCRTLFADGVLASSGAGFAYIAQMYGGGVTEVTNPTINANLLSYRLTGLKAATTYRIYAFVGAGGSRMMSPAVEFTTSATDDPVTPDPDPDQPTGAKYTGWAELPIENADNSDYYYAYHLRPDATKVRNYSVCYSARYACPVWIAAPMHDSYKGSAKRRDNYIDDPNISCTQNSEYSFSTTGLTRGHMLGSSDRTVTQATNDQVFYKSNIAPQVQSGFNASGGLWNNCENWVDTQWVSKADTTYQVIGSYWQNETTKINGTTVPTHFYKVLLRTKNHVNKWVSTCSRDELQCVAIFVPHNSANGGVKQGQFVAKGFVMSVADLEKKVGQTFFANVPNAPKDTYSAADWGL